MNLSPADDTPAPRTAGDPIAMRAAYTSGMVFDGRSTCRRSTTGSTWSASSTCTTRTSPSRVRQRVMQQHGPHDHLVVWFTDTTPGMPKASQTLEAMAVMDEWMANIRATPGKSIAGTSPPRRSTAASTCKAS